MDSLDEYIAHVSRVNHVTIDPDDSLCVLHTILSKFESDLIDTQASILSEFESRLEKMCANLERAEERRAERALSYIHSSAGKMLNSIPEKVNFAVQQEEFQKLLLAHALGVLRDRMTVAIPPKLWIAAACLAGCNILVLALAISLLI